MRIMARLLMAGVILIACVTPAAYGRVDVVAMAEYCAKAQQCGVAATDVVLCRFNMRVPVQQIIDNCPQEVFSGKGMTINQLQRLLQRFSVLSRVFTETFNDVIPQALKDGYAIILPNKSDKHFYLLLAHKNGQYLCFDPPTKYSWIPEEKAMLLFQGVAAVAWPKGYAPFQMLSKPKTGRGVWTGCGIVGMLLMCVVVVLWLRRRRRGAVCIFVLMLSLPASIAHTEPGAAKPATQPVRSRLIEYQHDFGKVRPGSEHEFTFTIVHPWDRPFAIGRVFHSCSCIDIRVDGDIKVMRPQSSTKVTIRLKVKPDVAGYFVQTSTIIDDSIPPRSIRLSLTGHSKEDYRLLSSAPYIDLGKVSKSQGYVEQVIYVERYDRSPVDYSRVEVSSTAVDAKIVHIFGSGINRDTRLNIKVRLDLNSVRVGHLQEWVILQTSNPIEKSIKVPIRGEVVDIVRTSPEKLFLSEITGGKSWQVKILPDAGRRIASIEAAHSLGRGWVVVAEPPYVWIKLEDFKGAQNGIIHGTVTVKVKLHDDPTIITVSIPVDALVVKSKEIITGKQVTTSRRATSIPRSE